jgi:carboxyl-terminal processing protease
MKYEEKTWLWGIALALISVVLIWVIGLGQATEDKSTQALPQENIINLVKLFDAISFQLNGRYVDTVDAKDLIYSGIRGMLDKLDPFTEMMEKKAYNQLMEITHGRYEGLGMQIDSRDNWIVVISPIEGTPAYRMGLKPGDKIIEIDGKSTANMKTEEASKLMRGPAGTKLVLKITREGVDGPLEYTIERAVIELKNVPYYGMIDDKIGYVRFIKFSEESGTELKNAIEELKKKGMQSLIFDLRYNGGGLLDQAVETANLFLDKDKLIVYTQGRASGTIKYHSKDKAVFPNGSLVVLVDGGTASASEIVAGAIQDWDRGAIIGTTTFGKGLVQQVYDLPGDVYLKMTIAKYYIPSGRCIQKPELSHKRTFTDASEETEDSSQADTTVKEVYRTNGGRIVYGGGGVVPDIEVEYPRYTSDLEINLASKMLFFDFAINYISKHKDLTKDFEITDQIMEEFKEFLKAKNFTYKTALELELEQLEKRVKEDKKEEIYQQALENLKKQIEREKENDFQNSLDYIKKSIKREILLDLYGEKAFYEEVILKTDPFVQKALKVLNSKDEYKKILKS